MEHPVIVTRAVDVDLPREELWHLVGDGGGWADWMVDDADIDVQPGAEGTVIDGDRTRDVRVTEVVEHERVSFEWWPSGDQDATSSVELVIVPRAGGAEVRIVETFPAPRTIVAAVASPAWARRTASLRACARWLLAA
jgi:uncharacterized protein YndB with AHSA1/START domain